jgi:hypothetical protein
MKTLRQARKERLAQRMSTVPRKVTQGDTLYDRVSALVTVLDEVITGDETAYNNNEKTLATLKELVGTNLDNVTDEMTSEDFRDALRSIWEAFDKANIEKVDVDIGVEIVKADLLQMANEIKQVALDTHGGTTNPTDLGEWLY